MRTAKRALIWQGFICIWEFFEKCNFTEWLSNYTLSHTQLDAYDLLGTPEQLLLRKKKKYKLFSFISWVKPSCWQWIPVFFLSTVGFCFSGILNYTLYTLPRICMFNQYFQLINVWKTSTSVAVDAGREVSCPSHLVLQKWVLR